MPSLYIECNKCGATFSGDKRHPDGIHYSHADVLREEARAAGWVGPMNDWGSVDYCPACQTEPKPIVKAGPNETKLNKFLGHD